MYPNDDFYQVTLTPKPSNTDHNAALSAVRAAFGPRCEELLPGHPKFASPYPFYAPPHRVSELQLLQSSLHTAVTAIIKNWWSTPRYQAAIPTSPKIERVLRALDLTRPYKDVGSWRPDFLIPEERERSVAICEINARFAFNGYFAGEYFQQYVQNLDFGDTRKQFKSSTGKSVSSHLARLAFCGIQ
ncbi:hypothetical protein RUND412_010868 [Rhizina undulata]